MAKKRMVEIFSAGCPACDEAVSMVQEIKCPSCEVNVLDMNETDVAKRAETLGIRTVPAILVDGVVADCCKVQGPSRAELEATGIGRPVL